MTGLFDSHAHLADPRFDGDAAEVMARMAEAGVEGCVIIGDGAADPEPALAMAARFPLFFAAVGVHPHDASLFSDEAFSRVKGWLARDKVVALGEIGLDFHYDHSPRSAQIAAFEAQLDCARDMGLPTIMHVREAHGEATRMLSERSGRLPRGVMHCYTGSWESAKWYMDKGLYISLSGAVTFKNAPKLREVASKIPIDRLLIETDCPYLAPVPMRGRRNEPAFVAYVAEAIARIRGVDAGDIADATRENARRLFGIPLPA